CPVTEAQNVLDKERVCLRFVRLIAGHHATITFGQNLPNAALGSPVEQFVVLCAHAPLEYVIDPLTGETGILEARLRAVGPVVTIPADHLAVAARSRDECTVAVHEDQVR